MILLFVMGLICFVFLLTFSLILQARNQKVGEKPLLSISTFVQVAFSTDITVVDISKLLFS